MLYTSVVSSVISYAQELFRTASSALRSACSASMKDEGSFQTTPIYGERVEWLDPPNPNPPHFPTIKSKSEGHTMASSMIFLDTT